MKLTILFSAVAAICAGPVPSPEWSPWTCCRYRIHIQSRERVVRVPRVEMEHRQCNDSNYCEERECRDIVQTCEWFRWFGSCDREQLSTYMSHHCPQTCKFCSDPAASKTQTTRPLLTTASTRPPWNPPSTTAHRIITLPQSPETVESLSPETNRPEWNPTTTRPSA